MTMVSLNSTQRGAGAGPGAAVAPQLTKIDDPNVRRAVADFNARLKNPTAMPAKITRAIVYQAQGRPSLEQVVALLNEGVQGEQLTFKDGRTLATPNERGSIFLTDEYSHAGPALYRTVNGDSVRAWVSSLTAQSHNGTSFSDRVVLLSEKTGRVVVLDGRHGHDG